jgi:hypothetical protein
MMSELLNNEVVRTIAMQIMLIFIWGILVLGAVIVLLSCVQMIMDLAKDIKGRWNDV